MLFRSKIFAVEEDIVLKGKGAKASKAFIPSKVMTRETYTLTGIEGDLKADGGKITFDEKDGIDYAATTVQTPGGERIPFLFTVKSLKAVAATSGSTIGPGFQMGGKFKVPSYRAGTFLDPKGRGQTTGYDQAQALPGLQADGSNGGSFLFKEDNKVADTLEGEIQMEVTNVNAVTGEIGGVFVSEQPGDTDMGALKPRTLLLKGVRTGSLDLVMWCLSFGADATLVDKSGRGVLHWAAPATHAESVEDYTVSLRRVDPGNSAASGPWLH